MSELSRWLPWKESQTFERKSCYDKSKTPPQRLDARIVSDFIAETLSAMANADGGALLVGQENLRQNGEDGGGEITGLDYNESTLELLRSAPNRLIVPRLDNVSVETHEEQGKTLLLFQVSSSPVAHHLTDGRCLLRVDTKNAPYDCGIVAQLKESQSPFERRPVAEATIGDLDVAALDWFANRIGWTGNHAELLEEYNLWNGQTLNRAAVLLFARKPLRWHDHPEITLVRYFGPKRGLGKDYQATRPQRLNRPLVRLIEEAYSALEVHIEVRVELRDLFFENRADYPEFAWQEAIVNAVGHRDYAITGAGTEIWMFDDHLDIRSPGGPPQPVSIEELRQAAQMAERGLHLSRNPLIVRVLIDAGYMREQGEGIPRMFQVMEEADLAPPELAQQDFRFVVTLRKTPVYDAETRQWLRQFDPLSLSREQRRTLAFARSRAMRFTNRDLQKHFGLDPYSTSSLIRSLLRKNLVRLTEPRGRIYEVVAVSKSDTMPEDLQTLLPAFQQREQLGSREIGAAWDLSYYQTYRRIRSLVETGWLEATKARGRTAMYQLTEQGKSTIYRR